jgi:hypothetical protein
VCGVVGRQDETHRSNFGLWPPMASRRWRRQILPSQRRGQRENLVESSACTLHLLEFIHVVLAGEEKPAYISLHDRTMGNLDGFHLTDGKVIRFVFYQLKKFL